MVGAHQSSRSDWILLALFSAHDNGLTAVKLQKTLFLLGQRRKAEVADDYYEFRPYHYGPFDADVYRDADLLEDSGMIEVDRSKGPSLRMYVLTDRGQSLASKISQTRSAKAQAYLQSVVEWVQPLPFNVLVRAIYDEFPAMRANSIFEER